MRTLIASILMIVPTAGASYSETCTAPGHSSCTVTCADGCGAIYYEPNGPCRTFCSSRTAGGVPNSTTFSSTGLTLPEVQDLLSDPTTKMQELKAQ